MLTVSTPDTVRPVRLLLLVAETAMFSVSVPAPPTMVSPLLIVVAAAPVVALVAAAVNVSLPAVPVRVSTLVVRV
jgi:hypothetical protein